MEFIWKAYDDRIFVPDYLMFDSQLWCSVAPLIHFSTVEFHFPDRVLRQFGFHQPILGIPRDHYFLHAYDGRGKAETDWEAVHVEYITLWANRALALPVRYPIEGADFDFESSEYIQWYRHHGKPFLTTVEGREECERYRKKYGGKGKASAGTSRSSNLSSQNTEGWPTTWEPDMSNVTPYAV